MSQARAKKLNWRSGLSWAVALVLVWLQVGVVGFSVSRRVTQAVMLPNPIAAIASSRPTDAEGHVNCFCMMCKGAKKKTCCCAPKAGARRPGCVITERCDGAASPDTLAAGSPLPLTVLPVLAACPCPPTPTERTRLFIACFARHALSLAPIPPHAPPQNLS